MSTCCSISDALMDPSLSSLSGDGKLRKEDTSGGREDGAGVDNYEKRKGEKKNENRNQKCTLNSWHVFELEYWSILHRLMLFCSNIQNLSNKEKHKKLGS